MRGWPARGPGGSHEESRIRGSRAVPGRAGQPGRRRLQRQQRHEQFGPRRPVSASTPSLVPQPRPGRAARPRRRSRRPRPPGRRPAATCRTPATWPARSPAATCPSWARPGPSAVKALGYATTPVVVNGVVYAQDVESNVMAIQLATGKVLWTHDYNSPNGGLDGVNVANGVVYAATNHAAVALDAATGRELVDPDAYRQQSRGHRHGPGLPRRHRLRVHRAGQPDRGRVSRQRQGASCSR